MTKKPSLLIVDADTAFASSVERALSAEGHRCQTAPSADRALEVLEKHRFDVLLADISPATAGDVDLAKCAKKVASGIFVIAATGNLDAFSYDAAMESGASDFIVKPFSPKELVFRIQHAMHHEDVKRISVTDELTGLYNRRGFYTLAEQQMKMARRMKRGIYLLYADVDGLKAINDRWGHQQGDRALIDAAQLLQHTYRESDIVARIGGDEFIVVPIGSTGDNIPLIIARLAKNLAEYNAHKHRGWKLRFSVGTSFYNPEDPCTIDQLLATGDRSMYEDKKRKA